MARLGKVSDADAAPVSQSRHRASASGSPESRDGIEAKIKRDNAEVVRGWVQAYGPLSEEQRADLRRAISRAHPPTPAA